MGSASGQETGCFGTPRRNTGKRSSGLLTPPTKITMRPLGVIRIPSKMPKDAKGVQQECGICLLLGSTNMAKGYSMQNHQWSANDHKIIGKTSLIPLRIQIDMPNRCMEGRLEKGIRPHPVEPKNPGSLAVPDTQEIRLYQVLVGIPLIRKNTNVTPGGENSNPGQTRNLAETKEMPKDSRARVRETSLGLLFRQGQGTWRRWRSRIRRLWLSKRQSSTGSCVRCRSGVRCRQRLCSKCLEASR